MTVTTESTNAWLQKHNVKLSKNGKWCLLYKATHACGYSRQSFVYKDYESTNRLKKPYEVGKTIEAPDYKPTKGCGAGLHFSPTPGEALTYHPSWSGRGTKIFAVMVPVNDELIPLDDGWSLRSAKCKARKCKVIAEVSNSRTADLAKGDQLQARRGGHSLPVLKVTNTHVTIRTKAGRESTMHRSSVSKSYVAVTNKTLHKQLTAAGF